MNDNERLSPLEMATEAADLLLELWPKPAHSTVQLETHQWKRLRNHLLDVIGLAAKS